MLPNYSYIFINFGGKNPSGRCKNPSNYYLTNVSNCSKQSGKAVNDIVDLPQKSQYVEEFCI